MILYLLFFVSVPNSISAADAAEPADGDDQSQDIKSEAGEAPVIAKDDIKKRLKELSDGSYPTIEEREKAVFEAATLDYAALLKSMSPMRCWIAQCYLRQGQTEKGMELIRSYIGALRASGDGRLKRVEEAKKKGTYKDVGWGEPRFNGFGLWALINAYTRWQHIMDQKMKDQYKYVFTSNRSYSGSTGNLSMICTLNLCLAESIWGSEVFHPDGRYGAHGPKAIPWLNKRVEYVAFNGSGEFASRPYMIYNLGTLLSLDNSFTDKALCNKATMAYEMSLAHAAGTWLRGNWATPAGRSYPDVLTQQPNGSAAMLWFYFGGRTPKLDAGCTAVFSMAEKFRPSPLIINAATDRSRAYLHRSRFDGEKVYQVSYVNKTYAVFSAANAPGSAVWGQTYPYGVMFDQPDSSKSSLLWITVPCYDDKPLTNYAHGNATRQGQFLQHNGVFLVVAKDLKNPKTGMKDRVDEKTGKVTNKTFMPDQRYILSYIPAGYSAVINDSKELGRVFLNYGSVLVAITSSEKFNWDPKDRIYTGGYNPADSEFRIFGTNLAAAIETAAPDEYAGSTPEEKLKAFRKDVLAKTTVSLQFTPAPAEEKKDESKTAKKSPKPAITSSSGIGVVAGAYTDRLGNKLEKAFDGEAKVNGTVIDYNSWPLVDNPWVHQERGGNMTVTDGKTTRLYDVKNWTIIEKKVE